MEIQSQPPLENLSGPSLVAVHEPAPDVVLLLVHGIGQQRQGSVVNEVGNAIFEWLEARYEGVGRVEVESAVLKPDVRGGTAAASTMLLVRDANDVPYRIQLVESLWAEEFDTPGFIGVLRFAMGSGIWLIFQYLVTLPLRMFRGQPYRALRVADAHRISGVIIGALTMILVALPAQVLGAALALLWLVPFDFVRKPVEVIVLGLSQFLGDSYLFVHNPLVRRALADRVRRDFDALPRDGTPVAVLAHSQGAAVALEMLERHPNPAPLVTYGAGIRKLHELVNEDGDVKVPLTFRILWLLSLCSLLATAGVIANVRQVLGGNLAPDPLAGLAFLVLAVLFVMGSVQGGSAVDHVKRIDACVRPRIGRLLKRQGWWLDVFATHDLVPAGPLVTEPGYRAEPSGFWRSDETGTLDTLEIANGRSFMTDHTSYWSNPGGFIDPVMLWLATALDRPWLSPPAASQPAAPTALARRNRWRRRLLCGPSTLRVAFIIGGIILGWRTSAVWDGLVPGPTTAAAALLEQLPGFLRSYVPTDNPVVAWLYGALTFLAIIGLHGLIAALFDAFVPGSIWRSTDRQIGLRPPHTAGQWARAWAGAAGYLFVYGVAAFALYRAVQAASYAPLLDVPLRVVLWFHRGLT